MKFDKFIKLTLKVRYSNYAIPLLDTRIIRTARNMFLIGWYKKQNTKNISILVPQLLDIPRI